MSSCAFLAVLAPGTLRGFRGRQGENTIDWFCCCPRLRVLHPRSRERCGEKCETHLEKSVGRQMPARGQPRMDGWMANPPRAPGLFYSPCPGGVSGMEAERRALPVLPASPAGSVRCCRAVPALLSRRYLIFWSSTAGSRDAGVLFLAVTQPLSCPGKCFSPFRVPGYLSVTHALRKGSGALRDFPDKRLRAEILAAAQALPRCCPTDSSQERLKARGV